MISRSILAQDVFELWGRGANHEELHADIRHRTEHRWKDYKDVSFRFIIDAFAARKSQTEKQELMNSLSYLNFHGPILMKDTDEIFAIFEDYVSNHEIAGREDDTTLKLKDKELKATYFGRWVCTSSRELTNKYDLKRRKYIATTSMDAELSLVTANMALAAPGKIFFDPFVGTGSFLVAASHFGAMTLGADIDGRSFKGGKHKITKENPTGVVSNFREYGIEHLFIDTFTSDLTNTPIRDAHFLDGIVCDPPYGIREGLKVLGLRDGRTQRPAYIEGKPAHT